MIRDFKFRIWDEKTQKMRYEEFMKSGDGKGDWIEFITERENPYPRERFAIMQFTGLLDREGKEIYENDIITHPDCVVKGTKLYVRWDNEMARFQLEDKEGKVYLGQLWNNEYIIIGNEFEEKAD